MRLSFIKNTFWRRTCVVGLVPIVLLLTPFLWLAWAGFQISEMIVSTLLELKRGLFGDFNFLARVIKQAWVGKEASK